MLCFSTKPLLPRWVDSNSKAPRWCWKQKSPVSSIPPEDKVQVERASRSSIKSNLTPKELKCLIFLDQLDKNKPIVVIFCSSSLVQKASCDWAGCPSPHQGGEQFPSNFLGFPCLLCTGSPRKPLQVPSPTQAGELTPDPLPCPAAGRGPPWFPALKVIQNKDTFLDLF